MIKNNKASVNQIGQVGISSPTADDALAQLNKIIYSGAHIKLAFANSHVVNVAAADAALADALRTFLVLPDGIGVDLGSRLLYGAPFRANLNGTDFIPRLIAAAPIALKVGLVGGKPGVAERAAQQLSVMNPYHRFRVFSHGYFGAEDEPALLAALAEDRPDLLLVAFGNPRQELWIAGKIGPEHAVVAAGVGALFDFLAGEVARAPLWVRGLRLEWLFRLAQEPSRLWRRYVLGNPAFLLRVLLQKWRGAP